MFNQTVYPSKAGAFPPASFFDYVDALGYATQMVQLNVCGVCICPSYSYAYHYPETVRN